MFRTKAAGEDNLDGSLERDLVAHRDVKGLAALPRGYGCAQDLFSIGIGKMLPGAFLQPWSGGNLSVELRLGASDRRPPYPETKVAGEAKPPGVSESMAIYQQAVDRMG